MAKRTINKFAVIIALVALSSSSMGSMLSPSGNLVRTAASIIVSEKPVYSFGAHSPRVGKYDCSSFVKESALRANLATLPRDSRSQFELLQKTGRVWLSGDTGWQNLRPGDLIFFSGTYRHSHSNPISHVMIYAGENQMIGAQSSGVGIFDFVPVPPKGSPGSDCRSVYRKSTVYAYARPDWGLVHRITRAEEPSIYRKEQTSYRTASATREYRYYSGSSSSQGFANTTRPDGSGWIPSR